MSTQVIICLIVWASFCVLLGIGKWNYGAVSLAVVCVMVITGLLTPVEASERFADATFLMTLFMFPVATAFSRTRAIANLAGLLKKASGGNWKRCMQIFILVNFVIGFFLGSAQQRLPLVYPLMIACCREYDISPSKVMFPLVACMLMDGTMHPFGSGAASMSIYNGILNSYGYTYGDAFAMMDFVKAKAPLAILTVIYFLFFSWKFAPDKPSKPITGLDLGSSDTEVKLMPIWQDILTYIGFLVMIVGLFTYSSTGLPIWFPCVVSMCIVVIPNIITMREAWDSMPYDSAFLYYGAVLMGTALVNSGAGDLVGNSVVKVLGSNPSAWFMYLVFWLLTLFISQFMQNMAAVYIVYPIAILACNQLGCSALGAMLAIQIGSCVSWFTPMATAVMPLVIAGGGYTMKDLIKQGTIPAVILTLAGVTWLSILFPLHP